MKPRRILLPALFYIIGIVGCEAPFTVTITDADRVPNDPQPGPDRDPKPDPQPDLSVELGFWGAGDFGEGVEIDGLRIAELLYGVNGLVSIEASISNAGKGVATATTIRLYQSEDAAITTSDTEIWTATVPALAAGETHYQWTSNVPAEVAERYYETGEEHYWRPIVVSAPSAPGTVFYGLCVDAVPGEPEHPPPPHWTFGSNCSVFAVTADSRVPYWQSRVPFHHLR